MKENLNKKIEIMDLTGSIVESIDMPIELDLVVNPHLIATVIKYQQSQVRSATAWVKNRGDVKKSTRKLRPQKGSGRSRIGNGASPHWRGGGVAFGPNGRRYAFKMPKKQRKLALGMIVADKLQKGKLIVVNDFSIDTIKTKACFQILKNLDSLNSLCIGGEKSKNFGLSVRNIERVSFLDNMGMNVFSIMKRDKLILDRASLELLREKLNEI